MGCFFIVKHHLAKRIDADYNITEDVIQMHLIVLLLSLSIVIAIIVFGMGDRAEFDDLRELREDAIPIQVFSTKHPPRLLSSPRFRGASPDTTVIFNDGFIFHTRLAIERNGITYYCVENSKELLGLVRERAIKAHDKFIAKKRKKYPEL